jgi:hypothetical protein
LEQTQKNVQILADFPKKLKKVLKKMSNLDLSTPYRRGGWTVRQVVHHLPDSHINAYIRMKMAVTEILPIIKPYEEDKWAALDDGKNSNIKISLKLLSALHKRWVIFLKTLSSEDLELAYYHPGMQRSVPLAEAIALYVWHSNHHLAHIQLVADAVKPSKGKDKTAAKKKQKEAKFIEKTGKKAKKGHSKRVLSEEQKAKMAAGRAAKLREKAVLVPVEAPAPVKPKRVISEEQKARMAAGRAAKKIIRPDK